MALCAGLAISICNRRISLSSFSYNSSYKVRCDVSHFNPLTQIIIFLVCVFSVSTTGFHSGGSIIMGAMVLETL